MRSLLLGLVVAVATLVPNLAMANDQAIARHIMSKLQLEQQRGALKGFHVDMRVDQGTVWYQGFVSDQEQKDLILRTAQKAKHLGVVQVVDDITVRDATATEQPAPTATAAIPAPPQPMVTPQSTEPQPAEDIVALAPQPTVSPQDFATPAVDLVEEEVVMPQMPQAQMAQPQMPLVQTTYQEEMAPFQQPVQNASRRIQPGVPSQTPLMANAVPGMPYGMNPGAYAPQGPPMQAVVPAGSPMPMAQASAVPMPVSGDAASLPSYAWPTYAAHPNYGAVTYPGQYSASAWPYIGPFYPYPQVPLGWRKVTMEWDDGWWWLDFHNR